MEPLVDELLAGLRCKGLDPLSGSGLTPGLVAGTAALFAGSFCLMSGALGRIGSDLEGSGNVPASKADSA